MIVKQALPILQQRNFVYTETFRAIRSLRSLLARNGPRGARRSPPRADPLLPLVPVAARSPSGHARGQRGTAGHPVPLRSTQIFPCPKPSVLSREKLRIPAAHYMKYTFPFRLSATFLYSEKLYF